MNASRAVLATIEAAATARLRPSPSISARCGTLDAGHLVDAVDEREHARCRARNAPARGRGRARMARRLARRMFSRVDGARPHERRRRRRSRGPSTSTRRLRAALGGRQLLRIGHSGEARRVVEDDAGRDDGPGEAAAADLVEPRKNAWPVVPRRA